MGEMIEFETDTGPTRAYLASPGQGSGPGVVVIQEWWGLVDHIRDVCDRFASEGFVALAPDLYDGETAQDDEEANRKMQELEVHDAALDIASAIGYLLAEDRVVGDRVGVIGYCMGGSLALVAGDRAAGKVAAVDSYYGVFWYGDPELDAIDCPVVMRVGTEDEWISREKIDELADHVRDAGADVRVEMYDGAGHAFFNDDDDSHHPEAAEAAWRDTLSFFREHLGRDQRGAQAPGTTDLM